MKAEKKEYTKAQMLAAMEWAEDNGRYYLGTDKKGQKKQFNEYLKRLKNEPTRSNKNT